MMLYSLMTEFDSEPHSDILVKGLEIAQIFQVIELLKFSKEFHVFLGRILEGFKCFSCYFLSVNEIIYKHIFSQRF